MMKSISVFLISGGRAEQYKTFLGVAMQAKKLPKIKCVQFFRTLNDYPDTEKVASMHALLADNF